VLAVVEITDAILARAAQDRARCSRLAGDVQGD
jgi:hypothetical protein